MKHKTKRYRGARSIKRNKLTKRFKNKNTKTKKRLMKGGWGGFVMPQSKEDQKQNNMYGGWGPALNSNV